jgi:membrane-associated phospholipid phosphatase
LAVVPLFFSIGINYLLVGEIDVKAGKLFRLDEDLVIFDRWLYGTQAALFIEQLNFGWRELYRNIFYDYLMLSYISYYFLPFYGALYYRVLPPNEKYKMVSFLSTIMVYYGMNFLFYLFIPVTGPQYYLKELFVGDIPMSALGQFFYGLVHDGQHTKIDCFPSGHTGIGVLITFWLYKIKHPQFKFCFFITLSIMLATLGLRYHYTLDLLAAFPMAILSFYGGMWPFPEKIVQYRPVEEGSERKVDSGTNTD